MAKYLRNVASTPTPQSAPLRPDQVPNSAGGYAWPVDDFTRLHRFLILGSMGGSYYASEQDLTKQNIECLERALAADGARFVNAVCRVSKEGLAPKQGPTLFALALAASKGDEKTRQLALISLPGVCRTPTMLFEFMGYARIWRGWGRGLRQAIRRWYETTPEDKLALHIVKYRDREGWKHRDALRVSHPRATGVRNSILRYAVKGELPAAVMEDVSKSNPLYVIYGFQAAQEAATPGAAATLINKYSLPRECVQPDHLKDPKVWGALLDAPMPIMAMVRNLNNMTKCGLLSTGSAATKTVVKALGSETRLRESRIHPMALLLAQKQYAMGRGLKGKGEWVPVPAIIDALDEAFYMSFQNVAPTGKRILVALDTSGSMRDPNFVTGTNMTAAEAGAALAMVFLHTEPNVDVVGFHTAVVQPGLSKRQRLDDVMKRMANFSGGTDCSCPTAWAREEKRFYDAIVIITDNETWAGDQHPSVSMNEYRRKIVPESRMVICAMVANHFSIKAPEDSGALDVVGFDAATPQVVSAFLRGEM